MVQFLTQSGSGRLWPYFLASDGSWKVPQISTLKIGRGKEEILANMNIIIKTIIFISVFATWVVVAAFNVCVAQNKEKYMYVFKDRYDDQTKAYIDSNSFFKEIKLLGGYMIDPSKKNTVNLESVLVHLEKLYPNPDDDGVLCVNLENKLYHNIRNLPPFDSEFTRSIGKFNELITFIRSHRPNLKIGIYGIPFRTYYASQNKWNEKNKHDVLLSNVDIIFPSLYILFPDKQIGVKSNLNYFKQNLDTALSYGDRLGKPVVPFIWYMINPGNRKYGGELLSISEMERYLGFILSYSSYGQTIDGFVWWESSDALFKRYAKLSSSSDRSEMLPNKNMLLRRFAERLQLK